MSWKCRSVQRLASCGWKFPIQGSLLYIPRSQHPLDNVKLLQKQLSNDEAAVPVQNHRRKEEKEKIKRIWQQTHYLCRYPWGTSTPAAPPLSSFWLSLSLSICQWRYKIPLLWRLSRDYPSVPQEVGRVLRCHITNVVKVIVNVMGLRLFTMNKKTKQKNNSMLWLLLLTSIFSDC